MITPVQVTARLLVLVVFKGLALLYPFLYSFLNGLITAGRANVLYPEFGWEFRGLVARAVHHHQNFRRLIGVIGHVEKLLCGTCRGRHRGTNAPGSLL